MILFLYSRWKNLSFGWTKQKHGKSPIISSSKWYNDLQVSKVLMDNSNLKKFQIKWSRENLVLSAKNPCSLHPTSNIILHMEGWCKNWSNKSCTCTCLCWSIADTLLKVLTSGPWLYFRWSFHLENHLSCYHILEFWNLQLSGLHGWWSTRLICLVDRSKTASMAKAISTHP